MDPQATLTALLIAVADGDSEEVHERAQDLSDWFQIDGFTPVLGLALVDVPVEDRPNLVKALVSYLASAT